MTPESLKSAANASKQISLEESYKILGTDSNAGIEEVMKVRPLPTAATGCQMLCCDLASKAVACH